ncbi:hypothetical protein [Phenylobacterium terrae]|uniref:hypothetical protein n=1 Tax=Phenylobacterium terrae TaxID=2665495 RepID=UPI00366C7E12
MDARLKRLQAACVARFGPEVLDPPGARAADRVARRNNPAPLRGRGACCAGLG